jgi:hypothetical protein
MAAVLGSTSVLGCFSLFVEFDDSKIPQAPTDASSNDTTLLDSGLALDTARPETPGDTAADSTPADVSDDTTPIDSALDSSDAADVELDAADAD